MKLRNKRVIKSIHKKILYNITQTRLGVFFIDNNEIYYHRQIYVLNATIELYSIYKMRDYSCLDKEFLLANYNDIVNKETTEYLKHAENVDLMTYGKRT